MTFPRSAEIQRWWPTTQTLDLVEGTPDIVATAVHSEISRYVGTEIVTISQETFNSLDAAFGAAPDFSNVPTFFLVLPTRSKWTVLWNNSFLCDGYDSLCHNLTFNHGLTTLHWTAHDECTTMQPGTSFCHRHISGSRLIERAVQASKEDQRWHFSESGNPLAQEDTQLYQARRKRDRLNEEHMSQLLARLGAAPWHEQFYAMPGRCHVIQRANAPVTVTKRRREDVLPYG
jgi:hypothetical protein